MLRVFAVCSWFDKLSGYKGGKAINSLCYCDVKYNIIFGMYDMHINRYGNRKLLAGFTF